MNVSEPELVRDVVGDVAVVVDVDLVHDVVAEPGKFGPPAGCSSPM